MRRERGSMKNEVLTVFSFKEKIILDSGVNGKKKIK